MSDRRTAVAFFFEGASPPAPSRFAGARPLSARVRQHGPVGVLVLLHRVHPLADDFDALVPPLEETAHALGAKVAIVDWMFNETVAPSWASADWPESWQIIGDDLHGFFRDLPFWEVGWVRRDVWDGATDAMKELVLEGATLAHGAHGIILRPRHVLQPSALSTVTGK